jgi:hypothetical protein
LPSLFPLTSAKRREERRSKQQEKITKENIEWGRKAVHPCCCSGETFPTSLPYLKENGCKKKKNSLTP